MSALILIPFPTIRLPSSTQWGLMRNDGVLPPSPANGYRQGITRSGSYWKASHSYKKLPDGYSAWLKPFMDQASRQDVRFRLPDRSFIRHGTLAITEAVSNGCGLTATTGWTAGASAVLSVNGGYLKVLNGAASASAGTASQALTLANGGNYLLRCTGIAGKATAAKVGIGSATGLTDIANATFTAPGEAYLGFTAGAANYVTLQCNDTTAGDFLFFDQISVTLCALVDGAGQSGNAIKLKGLPVSTNQLIARGDFLQLATGQLVRATTDGDSDSAGKAWVGIEPILRSAPADGSAVCLYGATAKFQMVQSPDSGLYLPAAATPPSFSDFSFDVQEDIYA